MFPHSIDDLHLHALWVKNKYGLQIHAQILTPDATVKPRTYHYLPEGRCSMVIGINPANMQVKDNVRAAKLQNATLAGPRWHACVPTPTHTGLVSHLHNIAKDKLCPCYTPADFLKIDYLVIINPITLVESDVDKMRKALKRIPNYSRRIQARIRERVTHFNPKWIWCAWIATAPKNVLEPLNAALGENKFPNTFFFGDQKFPFVTHINQGIKHSPLHCMQCGT